MSDYSSISFAGEVIYSRHISVTSHVNDICVNTFALLLIPVYTKIINKKLKIENNNNKTSRKCKETV